MKTVQISASLSRGAGGIFEIELALAHQLHRIGVEVRALGLEDTHWQSDSKRWSPIDAKVSSVSGPRVFGYSKGFGAMIDEIGADLGHLHSLWMYPSVAIRKWSERSGRPYVVTPNGMLEPWALKNSAWKKRLAAMLYENRTLHGAACLQANTEKELRDIRACGLKNPVCVIPNGVELVDAEMLKTETLKGEKQTLLFLGRLHPKKGLVNALKAWKVARDQGTENRGQKEWQFMIAGWDQGGHEVELKRLCTELGLAYADLPAAVFVGDSTTEREHPTPLGSSVRGWRSIPSVIFTGPAFGEAKNALLCRASAFILPSFSEGLPMSVLEAWSYRLAVLMTDHCNIPEGFTAGAALRIGTDVESIAEGMNILFQSPACKLRSLGDKGRQVVSERFTWPQVAAQMKDVYKWVVGGGARPNCVKLAL